MTIEWIDDVNSQWHFAPVGERAERVKIFDEKDFVIVGGETTGKMEKIPWRTFPTFMNN